MENRDLLAFFGEIDRNLIPFAAAGETLNLYLLGRAAMVLGFEMRLMTKDVDVLYFDGSVLLNRALKAFGKGSSGAAQHGFYLEEVAAGLPPLPQWFTHRSVTIPGEWTVVRPYRPEIHDLAASKLSRYHAGDREDIQTLCDSDELTAAGLQAAVDSAFTFAADEEEDGKRKRANENLKKVLDYLAGRSRRL